MIKLISSLTIFDRPWSLLDRVVEVKKGSFKDPLSTFFIYASAIKPFLSSDANTRRILTRLRTRLTSVEGGQNPSSFVIVGAVRVLVSRGRCFENSREEVTEAKHNRVSRISSARFSETAFHFRGRNDAAVPKMAS